jgi:hypothetical protein
VTVEGCLTTGIDETLYHGQARRKKSELFGRVGRAVVSRTKRKGKASPFW